jgi:Zn-finger nucleic acid-binding protein
MTLVAKRDVPGGPCPRCGRALLVLELANIGVEGCTRCGGLWLDGDSADRVLEAIHAGALTAAAAASACATDDVDTSGSCDCPRCRRPMRTVLVEGPDVEIDRCDAHGTWFDRDELQKVSRAAVDARRRALVDEAQTVTGTSGAVEPAAGPGADPLLAVALADVAADAGGAVVEAAADVAVEASVEAAGAVLGATLEALASLFDGL